MDLSLTPLLIAHKAHTAWRFNRKFKEITCSSENISKYLAGTALECTLRTNTLLALPVQLCAGVFLVCRCTIDCIDQLEKVSEYRNRPFSFENTKDLILALFELSNRMILLKAAFLMSDETKQEAVRHMFINMKVTTDGILKKKDFVFNCLENREDRINKLFKWICVPLTAKQLKDMFKNVVWALERLQTLDNKVTRTSLFVFKEFLREGAALVSFTLLDWTPDILLSDYEKNLRNHNQSEEEHL